MLFSMAEISIIIVCLNNKDLVVDCVKSIKNEGSGVKKELIVVDNGSNDGSQIAVKKLQKSVPNLYLIENVENLGYSKANNQGIERAKGEYLLLLNSDTIVKKRALGKMIKFARETKDAGVVGPKLLNVDGSLQASCFHFPTIKNAIREYWLGATGLFEKYAPEGIDPATVDAVVGAAFLITPSAFKKVGMLDERYFAYFEDIDYCRNVWKVGLKVYYYPISEIVHYHGATFKKLEPSKNRWKKLIPSSKVYHGPLKHHLLTAVLWSGQKWQKIFKG